MRRLLPALLLFAAVPARGQEHPIQFTGQVASERAAYRPGDTLTVTARAAIPPGWHLYSITQAPGGPMATMIAVGPDSLIRLAGSIGAPVPQVAPDPNFGIMSEWHADSAVFRVPLSLHASAAAGRRSFEFRVAYQTCTERYCLPPREDTLHLAVLVAGAPLEISNAVTSVAAPAVPAGTALALEAPTRETEATPLRAQNGSRGFVLFLWLAATMGALSLLTPCVFPMVPITISWFSQSNDGSRGAAVRNAALYALGIIGAFTGLGLGLSLLLGVAGLSRFAASPLLNLGIAALFIVFAASLFGVLQLSVPARLLTWLERVARGSGVGRVTTTALMGVTFALTTFTCTAPFVGTLFVSAAGGDWRWPAAGLLAFSTVFALPFFILALVPRAIANLPKSGEWMTTLKGTLAFVELGAALKFISNADLVQGWGIFTRETVIALWVVLAALMALYLLGIRPAARALRPGRARLAASFGAIALTAFLALGLAGRRLGELESFLPPAHAGVQGEVSWLHDDYERALQQAALDKRLVLIDFTGYTCTNCRWMEANMFPRPEIARALEAFVRVRLYTDGRGEIHRRQQQLESDMFSTVALPLYAIVDAQGRPHATFLGMTRDASEFHRFLSIARPTP